jgi:tetratricopeptide (TPR) repeat protein
MKWVFIGFAILVLNSGYLAAFAEPTLFYMLNVLLHVVLGVALIIPFFIFVRRFLANDAPRGTELAVYMGRLGSWSLSPCVLTGLYLVVVNATHAHRWVLYFHIAAGFIGVAFFQKAIRSVAHKVSVKNAFDVAGRVAWVVVVIAILLPMAMGIYNMLLPRERDRITNPVMPPDELEKPSPRGANSLFAPSAATTSTQKYISSQPFLNSASCGRSGCHSDIYRQWQSSAHHYSSFNNPWYRKSAEALLANFQAVQADTNNGAKKNPLKWCAGCHDPALLVSGMLEHPRQDFMKAPEAPQGGGVSCVACHSVVRVRSTVGQASYVIEETPLHQWAASENKILREVYDFLLRADPEPHRRSMMKPFHRDAGAQFCSTCHKAHLDAPVNQFRWIRSFNDYDPWQTGPFSSGRNRGYIAAPEGKKCVDCHMPLVALKDGGKVRSHRFLGANTALPTVNQDDEQLEATTAFLRDRQVSVEIFALGKPNEFSFAEISPYHDSVNATSELLPATLFALGDERSFSVDTKRETLSRAEVLAPLTQCNAVVKRGEEVRLDVIVRSNNVGHFFPSGKVEMSEAWLELQAFDNLGRIVFWSGAAEASKGPVDASAHFYRSYLVDGEGKPLDKYNSWAARAAAYVNLLPPGGAEVVRYRLKIPMDCGDNLHVIAKLNYRKFSPAFTQWVFAETNSPEVPIVEMARHEVTLAVAAPDAKTPAPKLDGEASIWESWSNYGWGLLAQNDIKNAEAAFLQVAQNAPNRAGRAEPGKRAEPAEPVKAWVNVGIVRLHEGNLTEAREAFETAKKMGAVPFKWNYYYAVTLKAQGHFNEALAYFKKVVSKFPRDRVAKLERGQLYLLMQDYERARGDFEKVLSLDPENVEAYYYLQQIYRKLGEENKAQQAARLYERFKANASEISFARDGPDAQNIRRERQPYHEHVSMPLP